MHPKCRSLRGFQMAFAESGSVWAAVQNFSEAPVRCGTGTGVMSRTRQQRTKSWVGMDFQDRRALGGRAPPPVNKAPAQVNARPHR